MRVRYVPKLDGEGREALSNALTVGREYVVIAIECQPRGEPMYRLVDDASVDWHDMFVIAALWPADAFEVTSSQLSPRWHVKAVHKPRGVYLEIGPESWMRDRFWDDLIEPGPNTTRARDDYQREVIALLTEERGPQTSQS